MLGQRLQDCAVALALLTRLPLPPLPQEALARQARSAWAWPLAGFVVGLLAVTFGWGGVALGLPTAVTALLIVAIQTALTGAMHEDGLADSADGLWGGWTRVRRLEIMKDSRTGTYGVLVLVIFVGLRWSLVAALVPLGPAPVLVMAVLSRAPMAALMAALPNARGGGLSLSVGVPPPSAVWIGISLTIALVFLLIGPPALAASLSAAAGASALGWIAWRKIGGQTGDILGASQQVSEVMAGLALVALLT